MENFSEEQEHNGFGKVISKFVFREMAKTKSQSS